MFAVLRQKHREQDGEGDKPGDEAEFGVQRLGPHTSVEAVAVFTEDGETHS